MTHKIQPLPAAHDAALMERALDEAFRAVLQVRRQIPPLPVWPYEERW